MIAPMTIMTISPPISGPDIQAFDDDDFPRSAFSLSVPSAPLPILSVVSGVLFGTALGVAPEEIFDMASFVVL